MTTALAPEFLICAANGPKSVELNGTGTLVTLAIPTRLA